MSDEALQTEVEVANARLSAAIARLESVLAAPRDGGLAAKCEALRDELAAVCTRYDTLVTTTETVSDGLDESIGHIKAVLGA